VTRFERVISTGALRPDLAVSYASDVRDGPNGPIFGVFLLEPLVRPDAPPVLVDLGWVPADPHGGPALTVAGRRTIAGYVRTAEPPSLFTPAPDLARRQFYALDPPAIGRALGLELAPFTLVAVGSDRPGIYPAPASSLPRPPNNHLQYAATWFTLAAIVLVGSAVWWRGRLRGLRPDTRTPPDTA
jgi:surfeit locus 1 family protein